jgi:hypothetical protein
MTRCFIATLICLLAFATVSSAGVVRDDDAASPESAVGDKWALVVGISKFKDPSINLQYAAKDAADFAQYLTKEAGFAPDHVKLLTDEEATEKHIMSELGSKWLPHVAAPDDMVVIFISSHGSPADMDVNGVNYIVAHDSELDDLYTTAIEMQDLVGTIARRIHAKRIVLLLDSCHSGAVTPGAKGIKRTAANFDLKEVALGNGQFVISSSQQDQVSWELKSQPNGAFTYCLLNVLRKEKDAPLPEVFRGLKDSVQQTVLRERGVLQTPVERSNWKGKPISLTVAAANPHPGLSDNPPVPPPPPPPIGGDPTSVRHRPMDPVPTAHAPITMPVVHDGIAILPSPALSNVHIRQLPPNAKVLWGQIKSADELVNLPRKFDESIFREMRSRFGHRVLGPHSTEEGLHENAELLNRAAQGTATADEWKKLANSLQAKYLVYSSVDEADWDTSVMANKYSMVVSANLISGDTGTVVAQVKNYRVNKAPFHGDVMGGRKYFENQVAPDAANQIGKSFAKAIGK